jgi:hypothetical protein
MPLRSLFRRTTTTICKLAFQSLRPYRVISLSREKCGSRATSFGSFVLHL